MLFALVAGIAGLGITSRTRYASAQEEADAFDTSAGTSATRPMTVLVTGGAGYIGSHTVRQLQQRGSRVVVLDNLSHGHPAAVRDAPLIVGDIGDSQLVKRILNEEKITAVIHLAGSKSVDESLRDPGGYFQNNVGASLTLLSACRDAGVKRVVFSSTCAVYGNPAELPISETTPVRPETPYGESKLMVERMLHWFEGAHGLRSVALRYFNAAGAAAEGDIGENWDAAANLVPIVMKAALGKGGAVHVFGTDYPTPDGTAIRDYIHVLDLADAHLRALEYLSGDNPSQVLNVGTGTGASVREVIAETQRVSGQSVPYVDAPRRPGDAAAVWAESRAAERILGWRPKYALPQIIDTAWRWHSTHPSGFPAAAGEGGQ